LATNSNAPYSDEVQSLLTGREAPLPVLRSRVSRSACHRTLLVRPNLTGLDALFYRAAWGFSER
jgi:hypothetical protein